METKQFILLYSQLRQASYSAKDTPGPGDLQRQTQYEGFGEHSASMQVCLQISGPMECDVVKCGRSVSRF
jgi:hypothetical protein